MINVVVWSQTFVDIEGTSYDMVSKADMEKFLKALLDKVYYGGETICLESATFKPKEGKAAFTEINRWYAK